MIIKTNELTRRFGDTVALDRVSFSIEKGDIFGFIGPNGAGKTTTLRILATLDEPTSGDASICGFSVVDYPEKVRNAMGFVPDSLPMMKDITVHEYLDFYARAYGLRGKKRISRVRDIEEFTGLSPILEKHITALSKGMKQRVSVARALVNDPSVLLLDEPAAGLDPRARIELRELLKALSGRGKTILISSHILTELTEICTGAVIIESGRLLRTGTIRDLTSDSRPEIEILIRVLSKGRELMVRLSETPGLERVEPFGDMIRTVLKGDEKKCAALLSELVSEGFEIVEFRRHVMDLEDVFMNITKGEVQ